MSAPRPSRIPVVLFYLSCVFCVVGTVLIVRSFFLKTPEDKQQVLLVGCGVALFGVVLAYVMNALNKRENARIIAYVAAKAEEMRNDVNSRQRFNENYGRCTQGQLGPNGVK